MSILAWPGYAENGSNDPKVNWVKPFETATGCKATVKYFGTSDEAFNLFKTGQYDVVSSSGDATLRMVADKRRRGDQHRRCSRTGTTSTRC